MGSIKEFLTSLGLPLGMLVPLAWLWNQGFGSLLPLAVALLLGVHVYWLGKRLPWHQTKFTDLSELNAHKSQTYASLQRRLARAAQALPMGKLGASIAPATPQPPSRWHASLGAAEAWFSRHLGVDIWTYAAFNKLLLLALLYPLAFLLFSWLVTDVGQMGQAAVLPSYGQDWPGFAKRMGVCLLLVLPILSLLLARHFRPHWVSESSTTKDFLKVLFSILALLWLTLFALKAAGLDAFLTAFALAIVGATVAFLTGFAFATAGAVAVTIALAGSVALMVVAAGAIAVAVVLTGAGTIARAVSFAGAIAIAIAIAIAFAVALAFAVMLPEAYVRKRVANSARHQVLAVFATILFLASLLLASTYLAPLWAIGQEQLSASERAFPLLLFLGILPLCNALFDWVSVGLTRLCLRQIAAGRAWAVVLVAVDILIGLLLTAGLFALVLKILQWMQAAGWGVDAQALVASFRANPFDPQVSWIAMLAITNMLPTLVHVAISFWGLFSAQIRMPREHVGAQVHGLLALLDANGRFVTQAAAPQASPIVGANGQAITAKPSPTPAHQAISPSDLNALFNYLYVDHWLVLLTVLGIVWALWNHYLALLAWFLGLWV